MEIITRKQAIAANLSKYFTGEICKNGHISERYVQSGSCQQCINPSVTNHNITSPNPELVKAHLEIERLKLEQRDRRLLLNEERARVTRENAERRLDLAERKIALSEQRIALRPSKKRKDLTPFRVILHYADVDFFKALLLASAMTIDPYIKMEELIGNRPPEGSGNRSLVSFQTFQADVKNMLAKAAELDRDRVARGNDEDDLRYRAMMRERVEASAREQAAEREKVENERYFNIENIVK